MDEEDEHSLSQFYYPEEMETFEHCSILTIFLLCGFQVNICAPSFTLFAFLWEPKNASFETDMRDLLSESFLYYYVESFCNLIGLE